MARRTKGGVPTMPSIPAYHRPFAPREPWAGVTPYGTQVIKQIRKQLAEFVNKKPDRSWAPKLLARVEAGENIAPACVQLARDVVGMVPEREPGSDDEG